MYYQFYLIFKIFTMNTKSAGGASIIYWVTQKSAQICTVIYVHLYCEGCVIICGYLWDT